MIGPLRTKDHPEANGRNPVAGDIAFTFTFPLESGESLKVSMGRETMEKFAEFIGSMAIDDAERAVT